MKVKSNNRTEDKKRSAFTLIEMIGVLAVIAILAALLIPRVFNAINEARINNAAVSCETVKTAAVDHYGKYGKFDYLFGTNNSVVVFNSNIATNYDTVVLMPEGLLDKPFAVKIAGDNPGNAILELTRANAENGGAGYKLDGVNTNTAGAQFVLEAVLRGIAPQDALDLNDRLDGVALRGATPLTSDDKGRVEYTVTGGNATVYVYLTHR